MDIPIPHNIMPLECLSLVFIAEWARASLQGIYKIIRYDFLLKVYVIRELTYLFFQYVIIRKILVAW